MSTLRETQQRFQAYVLGRRSSPAREVAGDRSAGRRRRMDIYAEAYRLRLIEALSVDYPALHRHLGEQPFQELCRGYIDACPSRHPSIRWFGASLARFLAEHAPWAGSPYLAELAAFEWLQSAVFDASDADVVGVDDLAAIPAARWPALTVRLHPAVRLARYRFNIPQLWQTTMNGAASAPAAAPTVWVLWRRELDIHWRSTTDDEHWMLERASAGESFSDLCEGLCRWHEPDHAAVRAVELLKRWLVDGLVSGCDD